MAWRIDEQVIRGEIDNRTKGRVTGRIWLIGREEPLEIDLIGNTSAMRCGDSTPPTRKTSPSPPGEWRSAGKYNPS